MVVEVFPREGRRSDTRPLWLKPYKGVSRDVSIELEVCTGRGRRPRVRGVGGGGRREGEG